MREKLQIRLIATNASLAISEITRINPAIRLPKIARQTKSLTLLLKTAQSALGALTAHSEISRMQTATPAEAAFKD